MERDYHVAELLVMTVRRSLRQAGGKVIYTCELLKAPLCGKKVDLKRFRVYLVTLGSRYRIDN